MSSSHSRIVWATCLGLASLLLLAAPFLYASVRYGYPPGVVVEAIATSDINTTVWAESYSESGFNRVTVGMTDAEVSKLVGVPLCRVTQSDGGECWAFSRQKSYDSNYHVRSLCFDRTGRVRAITKDFWID